MWNFAKKFIPGVQVEPETPSPTSQPSSENSKSVESKSPTGSIENGFVFVDESEDRKILEEEVRKDSDEPEEQQIYIKTLRPKKKALSDVVIKGTDWESVNYSVKKIECQEDEITGITVSESFIVSQYYIEPDIDVYNRTSANNELLLSLKGHEYGGGNLAIVEDRYLYSGSMDRSTICWDLKNEGRILGQTQDHFDYINAIFANDRFVGTGGKGDKLIFVYEPLTLALKYKLEGHTGWITGLLMARENILISSSADKTLKTWNLTDGSLLRTFEEDASITAMLPAKDLILFGDAESKLSFLDMGNGETLHLLPNILIGTGRYCRSSKYHDKGIDNMHLTDNGYLITASSGSKFVKIWKFTPAYNGDWEKTDVKELQLLRDHADYLTALQVYDNKIYSSCSDGHIYVHEFPIGQKHYDMAEEQEKEQVNEFSLSSNGGIVSEVPQTSTEKCYGRFKCRTGKTGISRSSSSFMVSVQLRPAVAEVKENIRLSAVIIPEEEYNQEWDPSSDSDEYEVVFETESESEEE